MTIIFTRLAIIFLSQISCLCFSVEFLNLNHSKFNKEWMDFLAIKKINNVLVDLESTENQFNLLEEFNDQLIIRCRPFDSTIDRHSDSRPYTENRIILSDGTEMSASPIQLSAIPAERFFRGEIKIDFVNFGQIFRLKGRPCLYSEKNSAYQGCSIAFTRFFQKFLIPEHSPNPQVLQLSIT